MIDDITGMISADHAGHILRDICAVIPGMARVHRVRSAALAYRPGPKISLSITDTITGQVESAPNWGCMLTTTPDRIVGTLEEDVQEVHAYDLLYFLDQALDRTWQVTDGDDLATLR